MLLSDIATHEAIDMDFVQFQVVPWSWGWSFVRKMYRISCTVAFLSSDFW